MSPADGVALEVFVPMGPQIQNPSLCYYTGNMEIYRNMKKGNIEYKEIKEYILYVYRPISYREY